MNIIRAGKRDAEQIAAIVSRANKDVAQLFGLNRENCPKHPSFCTTDWILSGFSRGEEYFFYGNELIHTGCVAFEQPDPDTAYLNRLAVLPEYRHRGIGAALVNHILEYAASKHIQTVSIGIIAAHTVLKSWYLGLGFIEKETQTFEHLPFEVTYLQSELSMKTSFSG